jgi:hypothetical protein
MKISSGEKGSVMRIEALAILFVIVIATASAVAADPPLRQEPQLPQFVSPAARADVIRSARGSNTPDETRQAAEVLSSKFSNPTPAGNSARSVDVASTTETSGTSSADVRDPPKLQGRVAVLVADTPSKSARVKKAKISRVKHAAATGKRAPRRMRVADAGKAKATSHRSSTEAHLIGPQENASYPASDEMPGVEAGWHTGIIGLLTNPTFWH